MNCEQISTSVNSLPWWWIINHFHFQQRIYCEQIFTSVNRLPHCNARWIINQAPHKGAFGHSRLVMRGYCMGLTQLQLYRWLSYEWRRQNIVWHFIKRYFFHFIKMYFVYFSRYISFILSKCISLFSSIYIYLFHFIKRYSVHFTKTYLIYSIKSYFFRSMKRYMVVHTSQWYIFHPSLLVMDCKQRQRLKCVCVSPALENHFQSPSLCSLRSPNSYNVHRYTWPLRTNTVDQIWEILHVSLALKIHTTLRAFQL